MTELEQQLTNALTALSKQYEAEMEQQAEWVGELQEQVQRLEESVKDLKPQLGRTEASAKDLKEQVADLEEGTTRRSPKYWAGFERDLEAGSSRRGNGSAGRSETMAPAASLVLLRGRERMGQTDWERKHERS